MRTIRASQCRYSHLIIFFSANTTAIVEVILDRFQEINFLSYTEKLFPSLSGKDRHVLFMVDFLCEILKNFRAINLSVFR